MSKLFAVLVLFAVIGSAVASVADVDSEIPTTKPRKGKALSKARTIGRGYDGQRVITVPKGDPRAQGPAAAPKPHRPTHRNHNRVVVEAEDVAAASAVAAGTPVSAPRVLKAGAPASGAGACLAGYNGATVAAKAAAYQTAYKTKKPPVKYSQPNRQFGLTAKYSDCSSFVTSILADTGYNCLFAAGRNTAYMNSMIRARGGYSQTAKLGDIVMWGSHTGIIVKVCTPTTYSMVAMGNSGAGRAECKNVAGLKTWGSGGWLGFWTPRP